MPDDLPGRPPRSTERLAVVRALAEARQRGELGRDDQLERTDVAVRVETLAELAALVEDLSEPPLLPEAQPSRRGLLLAVGGLVAAGAAGAAALAARGGEPETAPRATPRPTPTPTPSPTPVPTPTPTPTPTPEPVPSLLTVAGLEVLFADYHEKHGTWWAYELSVNGTDRANAHVPVGPLRKRRLRWWNWDPDRRWSTIFDPMPITNPDERAIDLRRIDKAAAIRNVPEAERSLNVENPTGVQFEFTHDRRYGPVVVFYVTNGYRESGAMYTDLAGDVLARSPFVRS
ncbi:hypothetical protein [Nocardioides humi]|uniref:DUF1707 domain-containing protein n=1 Tax=Nocardioides humi TaxID=449461 RepID=A0ABN2BEJ7_9ACTN|nr:hypothetical protein [Nocardioides humi]